MFAVQVYCCVRVGVRKSEKKELGIERNKSILMSSAIDPGIISHRPTVSENDQEAISQ